MIIKKPLKLRESIKLIDSVKLDENINQKIASNFLNTNNILTSEILKDGFLELDIKNFNEIFRNKLNNELAVLGL